MQRDEYNFFLPKRRCRDDGHHPVYTIVVEFEKLRIGNAAAVLTFYD